MIEAEAINSKPCQEATVVYGKYIRKKLLKVFYYVPSISTFSPEFILNTLDVQQVTYFSLVYSAMCGDSDLCMLSSYLLFWGKNPLNTINYTEFYIWISSHFKFPEDHLKCIIFNLIKMRACKLIKIPSFICKTFLAVAGKNIDVKDINEARCKNFLQNYNLHIPKEMRLNIEALPSFDEASSFYCCFFRDAVVETLRYFDPKSNYSRAYLFTVIDVPQVFFLVYFHGLISKDLSSMIAVHQIFTEGISAFRDALDVITPSDMAFWLEATYEIKPSVLNDAISYESEIQQYGSLPSSKYLVEVLACLRNPPERTLKLRRKNDQIKSRGSAGDRVHSGRFLSAGQGMRLIF